MAWRDYASDLSYSILGLYSQMDRETSEFESRTGLQCPAGCGQCCESSVAQATVLELLPAAQELFSRGEVQPWLGRIASIPKNERCIFYHPDPSIPGNGRCELYLLRPSVCRLFGFAVKKSKNGNPELVTCRRQKEQELVLVRAVQDAISKGMSVSSFDYFFLQVETLQHSLAKQRLPINQALQFALERYGLTMQLLEENGTRVRKKDKGPVLEFEQSV
jgi:Fe-S-cluster containining protein